MCFDHALQGVGHQCVVGVEESEQFAAAFLYTAPFGKSAATVPVVVEDADSAVASVSAIDVGRIIGRGIVDDYDLPVRICLGKNAVNGLLQVAAVIVAGNENGEHVESC